MKYITFTVPCYNSQDYMRKCVDSLLQGGDDVEIVIVNDGSKDNTLAIANEYATQYPNIVRVVDKPNGGHGSGVNAGLAIATGLYYKVVDSDDWVDKQALDKFLAVAKAHHASNCSPDLYIVNYVYEHVADNTWHVSRFNKYFPVDKLCKWNDVKAFRYADLLIMHALIYRTETLRQSGLKLPEHTFYVDDIFSYNPLPYVQTIYYMDIDFYRYFIGRADQSVNLPNMLNRYEQMIRVMLSMSDAWSYDDIKRQTRGLRRYLFHAIANYMMVTQLFVCGANSKERKVNFRNMWKHIKDRDPKLYRKLKYRSYVFVTTILPWRIKGFCLVRGYKYLCRKIKLGQI